MAIRKQVSVSLDTYRTLKALEFCTGRSSDDTVKAALARLLEIDPSLASKVAEALRVAA